MNAYDSGISPCVDCRFCQKNMGCAIKDNMQSVYTDVQTCDNLIIASPIFFSELTGPLLSLASRFQPWWCAKRFRSESVPLSKKNGLLLLTGGGSGKPDRAVGSANMLFKLTNTTCVASVFSLNTDAAPALGDTAALKDAQNGAQLLNELYKQKG